MLVEHATFPGCVIEVRAIAVHGGVIICVPHQDPHWSGLEDVDDIPPQLRREIAHFVAISPSRGHRATAAGSRTATRRSS